jgi:hypothetical protein
MGVPRVVPATLSARAALPRDLTRLPGKPGRLLNV